MDKRSARKVAEDYMRSVSLRESHEQLEYLRAQLAEVTRERDELRSAIQVVIDGDGWMSAFDLEKLSDALEPKP